MVVHGGQVLSSYTHVSDQHSTFGTKVIVPTAREAHYVLDDFLGYATDLPIYEHATDTHGVTLINFALFDLVGKVLSPRIRDLGKITMVRDDTWTTEYYQLAVQDLRAKGRAVPGELLAHISPAHSENVNFFGVITVDVEAELAKLDTGGWRPLRPIAPDPGLFP